MPNISNINGLTLCDETNVNAITIANITNIDGITKSCVTCSATNMVYSEESCDSACGGEECVRYYTDGDVGALEDGNHIYTDAECVECAPAGYYSDRRCEGEQASCYTIDADCVITRVTACR